MLTHIDLNCDMAESSSPDIIAVEDAMIPLITSVNLACGGHAGTSVLTRRTARLATQHGVAIGAHPGFADPGQFGRTARRVTAQEVSDLIVEQVRRLAAVLFEERLALNHVKPHGALYTMAAVDVEIARALVRGVRTVDPTLCLYALAGSVLVTVAREAGLTVVQEAFADRAYRADGSLVPRSEQGAVLTEDDAVRRQVRGLLAGTLTGIDGATVFVQADSICVHSDTPRAVPLVRLIRGELEVSHVRLAPVCQA